MPCGYLMGGSLVSPACSFVVAQGSNSALVFSPRAGRAALAPGRVIRYTGLNRAQQHTAHYDTITGDDHGKEVYGRAPVECGPPVADIGQGSRGFAGAHATGRARRRTGRRAGFGGADSPDRAGRPPKPGPEGHQAGTEARD